jgi:prepilin-type N-terminal cleavage/methylation domain-containing protein
VRKGFSLPEIVVVLAIAAVMSAVALPRLSGIMDAMAADAAARDVTTALAVTRSAAVERGKRARLVIQADSLRIDLWGNADWEPFLRWVGPADRRVSLQVSNPQVVFSPTGIGWGVSNTKVTLTRGSHIETITTSRVGRVKRW